MLAFRRLAVSVSSRALSRMYPPKTHTCFMLQASVQSCGAEALRHATRISNLTLASPAARFSSVAGAFTPSIATLDDTAHTDIYVALHDVAGMPPAAVAGRIDEFLAKVRTPRCVPPGVSTCIILFLQYVFVCPGHARI